MGLKSEVLRIKDILSDQYIRLDTKYRIFSDKKNFNIWNIENTKPLSYYIQPITSNILKKGELDDEYYLIDLKSIERKTNILIDIEVVNEIGSDKVILEKGDLIIPKMEPKKGQFFLNLNHKKYLGSTELIEYKINLEITNPKFLYYVLVNNKTLEAMSYLESGKTHRRVQSFDLLKIQIPNIPLNIQNEIVKKIEPIEQEIQNLKAQKKEHLEIINEVFADEFDFDLDYIAKERDKKLYKASFVELANDELKFDISLKYKTIFEKSLLKSSNQWVKLDKIVEVKGGKRLPKGENILEEDTGYKYIRVDDLSWSGAFDYHNVKYITYENHSAIKNYISNTDDILLTIVGATVGKCGLVTDEIDGHNITENFARLIIKNKTKYFSQYVTYCLQSKICQLQIDEFTGKGSQGKLALFRVKKIRLPDIEFNKQQQIVEKTKSQIDAQKLIDEQIEQKQKEISDLIYQCVKGL